MLFVIAAAFVLGVPGLMAFIAIFQDHVLPAAKPHLLNRHSLLSATTITLMIGIVLTAVGEYFAATVDFYPLVMSDKGAEIENAFRILTIFAVPVAAMVLAVMIYSVFWRGIGGDLPEDGPAYAGRGPFPKAWVAVTAGLTLVVMIYPGLTSLPKVINEDRSPDLIVDVKGIQWSWLVSYPDQNVSNVTELVLPQDRLVRFNITSGDVLHAFWVPAFLIKIDAVPGQTSHISLRATKSGAYEFEPALRLQCSQLCGLSHATMRLPVRVVSDQEFKTWVQDHRSKQTVAREDNAR